MTYDKTALRAAFAIALKYHPQYGTSDFSDRPLVEGSTTALVLRNAWRDVLAGRKLKYIRLDHVAGDIFASVYNDLRLPRDTYWKIAAEFFEQFCASEIVVNRKDLL